MVITVRYSCSLCWLKDVEVPVEARGGQEDVRTFMDRVTIAVGKDHGEKKPYCKPTTLKNLKIPIGVGGFIGAPSES